MCLLMGSNQSFMMLLAMFEFDACVCVHKLRLIDLVPQFNEVNWQFALNSDIQHECLL